MATIAYVRVSTKDQSTGMQQHAIAEKFNISKVFVDEATSGAVAASKRKGFSELISYVREGDTVVIYAIDRMGRNTIDVLNTVELLKEKGVSLVSLREGFDLSTSIGQAMLTMMAALAQLERENIKERQMAGIKKAKAEGKALGRPAKVDSAAIVEWRKANSASIAQTAIHFNVSPATVKRAFKPVSH
ncbi:recombinase family protein [Nitrincola alkalilacustris]|uniref:recombinase family protein n=1 Tax=Nitrincola alkalilacustris TaxID=1571224 RepID=UPI00124C1E92|nr:recombinase family protein [Nitrincola alkalilacustris]